jgi:hypothetical protein
MLSAGQNILLGDPRRMGKSFWMVTFADKTNRTGDLRVVTIDYQGVESVEEFLRVTVAHLVTSQRDFTRFVSYLKGLFDNVDVALAAGPLTLKTAFRAGEVQAAELLENVLVRLDGDIAADADAKPLVIAMDEVADAVLNIASHDATAAANLLRRLRHLRRAARNLRWIVAGSVGFHHVLAQCGAREDVVNDLSDLPFGPLDATDSATLTRRLAMGIDRTIHDDAVEAMYALTDGMPFLIQRLADAMRYGERNRRTFEPITAAEVHIRFTEFVEDRDRGRDATYFVTRIDRYYGEDTKTAYAILDQFLPEPSPRICARDLPEEIRGRDGFDRTLRNLIDDHYLRSGSTDGGDWLEWRYPALRAIYRKRRSTRG